MEEGNKVKLTKQDIKKYGTLREQKYLKENSRYYWKHEFAENQEEWDEIRNSGWNEWPEDFVSALSDYAPGSDRIRVGTTREGDGFRYIIINRQHFVDTSGKRITRDDLEPEDSFALNLV